MSTNSNISGITPIALLQGVGSGSSPGSATSVPPGILALPSGTVLRGKVISSDSQGNAILHTAKGDITIKTTLPLSRGNEVVLRLNTSSAGLSARIISVDGLTPKELQQQNMQARRNIEDIIDTGTKQQSASGNNKSENTDVSIRNQTHASENKYTHNNSRPTANISKEIDIKLSQPTILRGVILSKSPNINFLLQQLPSTVNIGPGHIETGTNISIQLLPQTITLPGNSGNQSQTTSSITIIEELIGNSLPKPQPPPTSSNRSGYYPLPKWGGNKTITSNTPLSQPSYADSNTNITQRPENSPIIGKQQGNVASSDIISTSGKHSTATSHKLVSGTISTTNQPNPTPTTSNSNINATAVKQQAPTVSNKQTATNNLNIPHNTTSNQSDKSGAIKKIGSQTTQPNTAISSSGSANIEPRKPPISNISTQQNLPPAKPTTHTQESALVNNTNDTTSTSKAVNSPTQTYTKNITPTINNGQQTVNIAKSSQYSLTAAPGKAQPTASLNQGIIQATVIGTEQSGDTVLKTMLGTVKIGITTANGQPASLPPGTSMMLQLLSIEPSVTTTYNNISTAPDNAANSAANLLELSTNWHSMREALELIQQTNPQLAQHLINQIIPQAGSKIAATTLFFVAALRGGDIKNWLGKATIDTLEKLQRGDIIKRLNAEFATIRQLFIDSPNPNWQAVFIPIQHNEQLHQARLFIRKKQESDGEQQNMGTRFIMEINLSKLGSMQFDGFIRKQKAQTKFDLIIRSYKALHNNEQQTIRNIFTSAADITGFSGKLTFQICKPFPINPMQDIVKHHNDLLA